MEGDNPQGVSPQVADFQKRIARGEHPYAAAARPLEGGSTEIRSGFLNNQFAELRSFLAENVLPDLEDRLVTLEETTQRDTPLAVGEYRSFDLDVRPPFRGMTESGHLALKLHQKSEASNRVVFRPYRLEKYMSVDISTDFGDGGEDGAYVSLSSHGFGYPYREQMNIGAGAELFSGNGSVRIVQECDVDQEGAAPASSIELRFYDNAEKGRLPDHKIATYVRREGKLVLDERGHWLEGVRKMGVQLPQEVAFDESKGELVIGVPSQIGGTEDIQEKRITFPERLSPSDYLEAVKNGRVDNKVLGGFGVS